MEKHVSFKKVSLHTPQLEQLSQVLSDGLKQFFKYVEVSVVQCPNLKLSPFNLAQVGLSGNEKIVDVGGPPYLVPIPNKNKNFSFEKIASLIGMSNVSLIGPCAGPHEVVGSNSEMIANLSIEKDDSNQLKITNKSQYAKVSQNFELNINLNVTLISM